MNSSDLLTPPQPFLFNTMAIVGVGLIGGSVGLAAKKQGLVERIIGVDPDVEALALAKRRGVIDFGTQSLEEGVREANLVLLATPVSVTVSLLPVLLSLVLSDALITDVGSVKSEIVQMGGEVFGRRFVGGHPMAGSEKNGVEASSESLFAGKPWAIVRGTEFDPDTDPYAQHLAEFVTALGATPVFLDSTLHDKTVATVSHLPHVLAYAFAGSAQKGLPSETLWKLAGSSFRDFTRIAHADPELWTGILLANRDALLDTLTDFETSLKGLREALESGNLEILQEEIEKRRLLQESVEEVTLLPRTAGRNLEQNSEG